MPQIELKGRVSLDGSGFDRTLTRIGTRARMFASSISGMLTGFFSAAYLTQLAQKTVEYGSKIHDLSDAHKVSAERLQEYDHAAKENGTTVEKLLEAQKKLAKARAEALSNPNSDQANTFAKLGFDKSRLSGLTEADDLMREFSDALKGVKLDLNSLPAVLQLIGERNEEAIPALVNGLRQAADDAHRLGIIMEASVAQQLDDISDKVVVLQKQLTVGLGPALVGIGHFFSQILGGARMGLAFLGGFFSKFNGFFEKGNLAEAFKAAREAAANALVDFSKEQAAIEEAQKRKRETQSFSVDDLIANQESRKVAQERARVESPVALNEFQRIGGFAAGAQSTRLLTAAEQQLRELRQIRSNTNPQASTGLF